MILTEKQKQDIWTEYNSFKDEMYAGKSKKERESLGQFFTPADMTIQMLEALDCTYEEFLDSDIIDPTSGSGNLLAAALILGVSPERVFGNEYEDIMVSLCRARLNKVCDMLGKPHIQNWQIHQGNALIKDCITQFGPEYDTVILTELLKKRRGLRGGWMNNPDKYKKNGLDDYYDLFPEFNTEED